MRKIYAVLINFFVHYSIRIYKLFYYKTLYSHSLALCEQGNDASLFSSPSPPFPRFSDAHGNFALHQSAGEQSTNFFFWHIPHFIYADQRRYLAISLRNGAVWHSHASWTKPAQVRTCRQPLTAPSSLIATLTQPSCAIEASCKVAATSGYRIPFRGTRNTEYPF